jgi:hypothetical protein
VRTPHPLCPDQCRIVANRTKPTGFFPHSAKNPTWLIFDLIGDTQGRVFFFEMVHTAWPRGAHASAPFIGGKMAVLPLNASAIGRVSILHKVALEFFAA